ncbi:MAG: HD domain-containing protein [Nitrosotalea sp.]
MQIIESAELFAKERHTSMTRKDGIPYLDHLKGMVNRLKNLGILDQEVLAAAWLHDIMEETNATFDEIDKRFGSRIAVLVLSSYKDKNLPKDQIEKQYIKQLKESPIEAKLIKLCDISTNLKDLKNITWSKTKKTKQVKKNLYYLNIIKSELSNSKAQYPEIQNILNGINEVISTYGQRPIVL